MKNVVSRLLALSAVALAAFATSPGLAHAAGCCATTPVGTTVARAASGRDYPVTVGKRTIPVSSATRAAAPAPCCAQGNCCKDGNCCAMPGCCKADRSCCQPDKGICTDACGCKTNGCCAAPSTKTASASCCGG